ncbi:MAG TPA: peptide ABC transporter substrate-binding protein [Candidatus Limnocylindria bacterium]|nr:peptide ABC transporter substrate-binding protein [Candidatus Limnocylindria bacterium]
MTGRDKFIVIALLGLLVAASVAAILVDREPLAGDPALGGTYVEGVAGVPQYLNPVIAATDVDEDVVRLTFSGLTRYDQSGAIVPDLAAAFRTESSGRVWTFDIRQDATWHDGQPVSADDVVYTVKLLQDRGYVGPYSDAFRGVSVERVDSRTVRFTLPDVYGPFADSTTVPLLPAHILGSVPYAELARQTFNLRPVGTGPFRVTELEPRQIVLSRNDDFYRARPARSRPYLDRVVLRFYPDSAAALLALSRGELDGVAGLASQEAERARALKNVVLHRLPTDNFVALFLNVRPEKVAFRDRAVRQAIATAIDRGRILQVAADGRGTVADQFVPQSSWAYVKDVMRYAYSTEEAKALLDAADWKDRDGDGIREKGAQKLAFTIATSDEPARTAAATQIQHDLNAVGMSVTVKTMPFGQLVDSIARQRTFDALLVEIAVSGDPDPYTFFHSTEVSDPGHNFSGFSTLPTDRNLEAARRTFDEGARRELYAQVFQLISREVPVVYLYFSEYLYAQTRQVQGLRIAPLTDPRERFWNVEEWYVRTQPRR